MPFIGPDPRIEKFYYHVTEMHKNAIKKALNELSDEGVFTEEQKTLYEENEQLKSILKDIVAQIDIVYNPQGSIQRIIVDIDKNMYDTIYKVCFDE